MDGHAHLENAPAPDRAAQARPAANAYPARDNAPRRSNPLSQDLQQDVPQNAAAARSPYRHHAAHITQDPITDDGISYVSEPGPAMRGATRGQASGRRHMGTATSDPQYLPPVDGRTRRAPDAAQTPGQRQTDRRSQLHYERYLETPKPGKTIFTSRYERSRRRSMRAVIVVLLLAVIIALVWFFFLR